MNVKKNLLQSGVLTLSLLATSVMAAVSPYEAAKLGSTLTLSLIHISEPTRPY